MPAHQKEKPKGAFARRHIHYWPQITDIVVYS